MGREANLLKYIDTSGVGLEIAPYFNPLVPKRKHKNVLILDVVNTETLRSHAQTDPLIPDNQVDQIEHVDIVGDACQIHDHCMKHDLAGKLDFVVSSHNFEHLPNPIKFLTGVEQSLKPGGVLSMAVPDYRACFDFFRMPTRLTDWLQAFHEDRTKPSPESIFDQSAFRSMYVTEHGEHPGCHILIDSPSKFEPVKSVRDSYSNYVRLKSDASTYIDTHCSVFFPELFELLVLDLQYLGLVKLEVIEISKTLGHEFFVHFKRTKNYVQMDDELYYARRDKLLRAVSINLGASVYLIRDRSIFRRLPRVALMHLRHLKQRFW